MINLTELEQLARAATPGPWENHFATGEPLATFARGDSGPVLVPAISDDIEYIAAFNPQTALKLIEALRTMKEALEMGAFHHNACPWLYGKECCCAHDKVDKALAQVAKILGSE